MQNYNPYPFQLLPKQNQHVRLKQQVRKNKFIRILLDIDMEMKDIYNLLYLVLD